MINRFLFLILLCTCSNVFSQNHDVFSNQVSAIKLLIKNKHYNSKPINDSLSKSVFNLFLENLDIDKRFFLKSDIDLFKTDEFNIDSYIRDENEDFINKYISTLKQRVEASKIIIQSLKNEVFDYSGKDTLYFLPKKNYKYYNDKRALKKYWGKRIRYKIIVRLLDKDSIIDNVRANFKSLEQNAKPSVLQNEVCLLDEIINQNGGIELFVKEAFLNAYANYQDPHSMFFNVSEKMVFESSVSNKQETFGITTAKNKNGDIIIAYIVPSSPAFKNGKIEVNDIVQSLTSNNTVLETLCISNEDIIEFTNSENHKTISFKIKKRNGSTHNIKLTKKDTKIEENTINGYIISGEKDFGYINIPSFYTDLESSNGFGVSNDVAKELYKLQKEKINALIIDLRFNGGGSIKEAAELSGMFINKGPLSILKYKDGSQFTIRDSNRGSLFTKPIIIIINSYSASASEFFASAMQDYNRAIIVGSKSFGKSSAQVILPLNETENLGYCKITVEKFYRVTGKSNQSLGVIPDIEFPSFYNGFEINEQYKDYALINDTIGVTLKHSPLNQNNLENIIKNSRERIKNNKSFTLINKINKQAVDKYFNKDEKYPLTLDNVYNDITSFNNLWKEINSIDDKSISITAKNNASRIDRLNYNQEDKKANEIVLKSLSKDIFIKEACQILSDYINTNTTN